MHLFIFLVACAGVVAALIAYQNYLEAKQLHNDRIDLLSNRHISIDQVLAEIMDKEL
jgi:hypothetical protein